MKMLIKLLNTTLQATVGILIEISNQKKYIL